MFGNELIRLAEHALQVLPLSIIGGLGVSLLMRSASAQVAGLADFWAFLAMLAVAAVVDAYVGAPASGVIRMLYGVLLALGAAAWIIALAMRRRSTPHEEVVPALPKETPRDAELTKRIEDLERALVSLQEKTQRGTPTVQSSRAVEVERIIVRDSSGNRRAELGMSSEGPAVGVRLFNQEGKDRVELTVGSDGLPILRVCDLAGKIRAGLGVTADGWTVLALFDQAEKARAHLSVKPDGSPDLNFRDQAGTRRAEVGLTLEGEPWVALFDQRGEARSVLGLKPDGSPDLNFRDQVGKVRADMFVAHDGAPGLVLLGDNEQTLFSAP